MKKEKEIKLNDRFGKEFSGSYVFESISWGKSNQITSDCTSISPVGQKSSVDMKRLQALMLYASLKEKPKAITLERLLSEDSDEGLPPALGELLMACADHVNGFSAKDREEVKNLKQQWGLD